jgi:predicted esterase
MEEKQIIFSFKARYYKIGQVTAKTKAIWFVIHGYGQLAQYFIQKFKTLESKDICVIAPEGLSRFYLEQLENAGRKNNRVGASWMTRENRLTDISNYLEFLDSIYRTEVSNKSIDVTVLGFSQGSATASRWVTEGKINFDRLILWAGMFPPDMDFNNASTMLKNKKVSLVYGTKDRFITDERFAEMELVTGRLGTTVDKISFDGGHEIDETTLNNIAESDGKLLN